MGKILKRFMIIVAAAVTVLTVTACSGGTADKHEHIWDGGTVTAEATCTKSGERVYKCTFENCEETKSEPIGKLDHDYGDGIVTTQSTCSAVGEMTYTCKNCTASYATQIEKLDHEWDEGVVTAYPDLTSDGVKTFTCKNGCGQQTNQNIVACDDFAYQFVTDILSESKWQYGTATISGEQVGFSRIMQTDESEPQVWAANGVKIGKGWVQSSSNANAAIFYRSTENAKVNFSISFVGENSTLSAKLFVGGSVINLNSESLTEWSFITENAVELSEGSVVYLVFDSLGEATASGTFTFSIAAECIHEWNEGEITTAATCVSDGEKKYTCTVCEATRVETITERPAHTYSTELSHSEQGHYHKCNVCEQADSVVAHTMIDNGVETEPQFGVDGVMNTICSVCGFESTRAIDALIHRADTVYTYDENNHWHICSAHTDCGVKFEESRHEWNEGEITTAATCVSDGEKKYTCTVCGATRVETITERPAHTYSTEWSHSEQGHYHKCNVCEQADSVVAHTMIDNGVKVEPTYGNDGIMNTICSVCGFESTRVIPAIAHTESQTYGYDENNHWHICSAHTDCGVKFEESRHEWNEGEITTAATCVADGEKKYTCTVCGAIRIETITERPAHTYSTEWSHSEQGHYHKCNVCEQADSVVAHDLTCVSDGESTHHNSCKVCGYATESVAHNWNAEITLKPTLSEEGTRTYICNDCGATKNERIAAGINFADDFTIDSQSGSWKYGSIDYLWDQENFNFTELTEKNGGGDGWIGDGVEIKSGWINANNMLAVAYTASSDMSFKLTLNFTGSQASTNLSVRIGIKNGEVLKSAVEFFRDENSNILHINKNYSLNVGDTIYIIFGNEGSEIPNGELSIVLTGVASFADDFTIDSQSGSWKYGSIDYLWDQENFNFTELTEKNGGGDGWIGDGVEIKSGWINANGMLAVAYTASSDMTVNISLTFKGNAEARLALRTAIKDSQSNLYDNPVYNNGGGTNVITQSGEYTLNDGDTIYFIFGNEGSEMPNGELEILIG